MPVVDISGLKKIYKQGEIEIPALRGVDLAIDYGEFVAVVGPSGSGKTTLLNLIGGLDRPSAGSVRLDGVNV
ncbi:MAG: ATP-binding cassette domain-containing protein, partial [Myxococcota bacterium]